MLALFTLILIVAPACGSPSRAGHPRDGAGNLTPSGTTTGQSVAEVVGRLGNAAGSVGGQPFDLAAYVNPALSDATSATSQSGCPVVIDRLSTLTDQPFPRQFSVVGVDLPNPTPAQVPSLTLVVPYALGIIDIPEHALLRGHLSDPQYAECPRSSHLFVLDKVVRPLASEAPATPTSGTPTVGWHSWRDAALGITLRYPPSWTVSETHDAGSIVDAQFRDPDTRHDRLIELTVIAGQTFGSADPDVTPPEPLRGDRLLPAKLGPAPARLVDAVGQPVDGGEAREIRLVLNYQGDTVILATHFSDGAALDRPLLDIFTGMAGSTRFAKGISASDPLDPTLSASATLGPGPFIGQATAEEQAVAASGLRQATAIEAKLVPERSARLAVSGSCRTFEGHAEGVWLVTVDGVMPTGQHSRVLVYLDGQSGDRLCQTPLSP